MKEVIDLIYPVGQTIIRDHNPQTDYPWQTWEQDCVDRFPVGAGNKYALDQTGGEETHTLTVDEMPAHNHTEMIGDQARPQNINILKKAIDGGNEGGAFVEIGWRNTGLKDDITTTWAGGSQPHNNMPPYKAVRMWTRTA